MSNGVTLAAAATANSLCVASKAQYPRIVAPISAVRSDKALGLWSVDAL